jgi:hypothetical protein
MLRGRDLRDHAGRRWTLHPPPHGARRHSSGRRDPHYRSPELGLAPVESPPPRTCSADCTSTAIDPNHCGDCNTACPARPNALPVYAASQCDFVCGSGWHDCDGLATTGCEAAILTDSANCGTCGNACAGGGACFDGHCPFGLDFDGIDDTLASKTALAHGLSSTFTAEFWIRADGTTWMKLLNIHNGPTSTSTWRSERMGSPTAPCSTSRGTITDRRARARSCSVHEPTSRARTTGPPSACSSTVCSRRRPPGPARSSSTPP